MELFVLHAAPDAPWVNGYLLPALGLPAGSVGTPADFTLGASRVAELERAVTGARVVVLVLTPAFLDDTWSELGELLASHGEAAAPEGRLVPLTLEPCRLPVRLDFRVGLDCTSRDRWDEAVATLRRHLGRAGELPAAQPIACPYPGMMAFDRDQAGWFFGRDREGDDLARRLPRQGLVMVIGPSGSGKTSLVFAGLLPRLAAAEAAASWQVRSLRPGPAPTRALAAALAGRAAGAGLLLVVDQLEELFAQAPATERRRFLAELARLRADPGCTLLLTMRADFYPDLMDSVLWPLTEGERLELAPLRGQALRDAIAGPAAKVGVHLEPALVERLLADAAAEPGVLPLLQETMALLWEHRTRRLLTLDAYRELGGDGRSGLATALATRADAAFAELPPAQQQIARRILLRLVQLGEGRDDTRRQQPVAALRAADDDPASFDATLRQLTRHRLLTLGGEGDPGQDASRADLAHEALIGAWPALRRWVDEDRQDLRVHAQLADDAQVWTELGRSPDALYRGGRLASALEWAERHPDQLTVLEREFLDAARRHRADELAQARRQATRLRWSAAALAVLLVLATVAGLLAVRSAGAERRQAGIATSRYLVSQAAATAAGNPDLSILLSVAAYASSPTDEARLGLQDQLVRRRHVRRILTPAQAAQSAVAASADGTVLAAGGADGRVRVWQGDGRGQPVTLGPPAGPVQALAVGRDGRTVAAAGPDGIRLWDLADPDRPRPPGPGSGAAGGLAFTPDGRRLVSVGPDGGMAVWDLAGGGRRPLGDHGDGPVEAVVATPDGRGVLSLAGLDVHQWSLDGRRLASFRFRKRPKLAVDAKGAIAVSPDGRRLAVTGDGTGTKVWDLASRRLLARDIFPEGTALTFGTDDDTVVLTGVDDKKLTVYKLAPDPSSRATTPLHLVTTADLTGHAGAVLGMARGPGATVASGGADGRVILWATRPGDVLTHPGMDGVGRVAFARDSRRLVAVDRDGVTMFDVASRSAWGRLAGPLDGAISPDGRTLATAGRGNAVALYDLGSRKLAAQLRWAPKGTSVLSAGVEISPDGTRLVEKDNPFRWLDRGRTKAAYQGQFLVVWDLPQRRRLATCPSGRPASTSATTTTTSPSAPTAGSSPTPATTPPGPPGTTWTGSPSGTCAASGSWTASTPRASSRSPSTRPATSWPWASRTASSCGPPATTPCCRPSRAPGPPPASPSAPTGPCWRPAGAGARSSGTSPTGPRSPPRSGPWSTGRTRPAAGSTSTSTSAPTAAMSPSPTTAPR